MIARALAIAHTCMFDAWAAYDRNAVGTQLGASLRRPMRERTFATKNKAVSFAAYRAAVDLFPNSKWTVFDPLLASLGYDPSNTTTDTTRPAGIGNVACQAVLDYRHRDGSNQLGDEPGGQTGVPYSDYTSYTPKNDPMDLTAEVDLATVKDVNHWQPLTYVNAAGQKVTPKFLGHHWNLVTPFALTAPSQFRHPTGPTRVGSGQFEQQAADVLALSAGLTDSTEDDLRVLGRRAQHRDASGALEPARTIRVAARQARAQRRREDVLRAQHRVVRRRYLCVGQQDHV